MLIAVPAAAEIVSELRRAVVYAAASAQKLATYRSMRVGDVRARISLLSSCRAHPA
jgi:hypothetical protein